MYHSHPQALHHLFEKNPLEIFTTEVLLPSCFQNIHGSGLGGAFSFLNSGRPLVAITLSAQTTQLFGSIA